MNVLERVFSDTSADPARLLIAAWSGGGFLMHYVANQYPERFAALCSRACFFTGRVLSEENARRMAGESFPVMIYYAKYDGPWVKIFSWNAIRWYTQMGFKLETAVILQTMRLPFLGLGHVEGARPDIAAEFFTRCAKAARAKQ